MALKVKAREKLQKIGAFAGEYRYVMMSELYTPLSQEKVIIAIPVFLIYSIYYRQRKGMVRNKL